MMEFVNNLPKKIVEIIKKKKKLKKMIKIKTKTKIQ